MIHDRMSWPTALRLLALTTLTSLMLSTAVFAADPPHMWMTCSEGTRSVGWSVTRTHQSETYTASPGATVIQFYEDEFFRRPEAVAKMEYANACLTALQGSSYTGKSQEEKLCSMIDFLGGFNAFGEQDLYQLEEFSYSRTSQTTQFDAYALKLASQCFYR